MRTERSSGSQSILGALALTALMMAPPAQAQAIKPYQAPVVQPYQAPVVQPYQAPLIKPVDAPKIQRHDAQLTPDDPLDGHFVDTPDGKLDNQVVGRWNAVMAGGSATVDNADAGIRTTTNLTPAEYGMLVIRADGTYSWGPVRNGHIRFYVPHSGFFFRPEPCHTFVAVSNGLHWYFLRHDPDDGKLYYFKTKLDWNDGQLFPR